MERKYKNRQVISYQQKFKQKLIALNWFWSFYEYFLSYKTCCLSRQLRYSQGYSQLTRLLFHKCNWFVSSPFSTPLWQFDITLHFREFLFNLLQTSYENKTLLMLHKCIKVFNFPRFETCKFWTRDVTFSLYFKNIVKGSSQKAILLTTPLL